ncbi:sugar phosphatase [Chryseobacterium sp. Leaf404]|uniref:Cof-type HAD-IIB family hydrolase n=1 Tax=unclassified Chryseobacterium TaxID=2593645 RepID=UPI0006F66899|nr:MULTISPECIES: Cof-type HAD-IIB family hydrolase [unclassified Chryseobacterium]KQT18191.1 sugar phosphatase [Chryseobacterium sp. Leaf404]
MKDIKMIVTDMDGTFLNSKYEVSPEFPEIYEELKKRDILFVPASGRQMSGITKYFGKIESEIGFIAENGGYIIYRNKEIFADRLEQNSIADIIKKIREIPSARAVLSAKANSYYESDDQDFVDYFSRYYTKNQKKKDLTEAVDDSVFKIAVYHPVSSEEFLYPELKKFENENLAVVVSGKYWVDIMNKHTNKGIAIEKLQKSLNILPEETMAFGDYLNDIEMLKNARYSFAMKNAHPSVKEAAKFEACSNDSFGVTETIKNYLNQQN